jgi:beta-aspartyl-dipeptidase (metallo-type)
MIGGKAGVTHFHVGPSERRLRLLHALLDEPGVDVEARRLYPTHVTRTPELMDDAIALARRGAYVDTDAVEPDTGKWLSYYLEHGGPAERFTFSSDAHTPGGSPDKLYQTFVQCVREHGVPVEHVLPHFGANAAAALGLAGKGVVREGGDADVLVVRKGSLELRHVIARGRVLMRDGRVAGVER